MKRFTVYFYIYGFLDWENDVYAYDVEEARSIIKDRLDSQFPAWTFSMLNVDET